MKKLSAKVLKRLKKASSSKVISINDVRVARDLEGDLSEGAKMAQEMLDEGHDPMFAASVEELYTISRLTESLLALPELARHLAWIEQTEHEYMPSQPPQSPVTGTFFQLMSTYDVGFGIDKATLGDVLLAVAKAKRYPQRLVDTLENQNLRHTGIYRQVAIESELVILEDVVTTQVYRTLCVNPFQGHEDALWLVRLSPSLLPGDDRWLTLTTPYVLTAGYGPWMQYLSRQGVTDAARYQWLMKPGPNKAFWLEFIHQAYEGVYNDGAAIKLAGLPDVIASRPHASNHFPDRLPESSVPVEFETPDSDSAIGEELPYGEPQNAASEVSQLLTEMLEQNPDVTDLDDVRALAAGVMTQHNDRSLDDFCGLSPSQMTPLLYEPFAAHSPLRIQRDVTPPAENRLFAIAWHLLGLLANAPIKLTAKGNLPLKVCRELNGVCEPCTDVRGYYEERFRSEEDLVEVHTARLLTELSMLAKPVKGKLTLSSEAKRLRAKDAKGEIAARLIETHVSRFNWAYFDGYGEIPTLQMSAGFSLYLFSQLGDEYRRADDYGERILKALPLNLHNIEDSPYRTMEQTFLSVWQLRAINRFAALSGLLSLHYEVGKEPWDLTLYVRKTAYHDALFQFDV